LGRAEAVVVPLAQDRRKSLIISRIGVSKFPQKCTGHFDKNSIRNAMNGLTCANSEEADSPLLRHSTMG
jgi:hypothetical protein